MSGYDFHPEALVDLNEIRDYIAYDSSEVADKVVARILKAVRNLVGFPNQGHSRTDLTTRPLRFLWVGNYLIAYAPDRKPLWVIAVMNGHRSPRVMAAILRGRESVS